MLITLMLLALGLGPGAPIETLSPPDADRDEIESLTRALALGMHRKDAAAIESILHPEFVLRSNPDVGRDRWIKNALTLCWGSRSDIRDFTTRQYGEATIASFVFVFYQDPVSCQPAINRSLITDIWVRHDGRWQLAVRHTGPAADPGSDPLELQFLTVPEPPPVWQGTAELSLVATGGNTDAQTVGAATEFSYRPGPWNTAGRVAFVQTETAGAQNARSFTAQIRQSREISPWLELYSRGAYRRDEFAGIDHRYTLDGGLAYKLVETPRHTLQMDTGFGHLREDRVVGDHLRSVIANLVVRYAWKLSPRVELSGTTNGTSRLEELDDWRLTNELALTTGLTQVFSLKLSHSLNYLNVPVPGFERRDTIVSAALVASFRR